MIQYSNVFRSYLNSKLVPKWEDYSNEIVELFLAGASQRRTVDYRLLQRSGPPGEVFPSVLNPALNVHQLAISWSFGS